MQNFSGILKFLQLKSLIWRKSKLISMFRTSVTFVISLHGFTLLIFSRNFERTLKLINFEIRRYQVNHHFNFMFKIDLYSFCHICTSSTLLCYLKTRSQEEMNRSSGVESTKRILLITEQ